jgi:hypothetical protein
LKWRGIRTSLPVTRWKVAAFLPVQTCQDFQAAFMRGNNPTGRNVAVVGSTSSPTMVELIFEPDRVSLLLKQSAGKSSAKKFLEKQVCGKKLAAKGGPHDEFILFPRSQ